MENLSLNIHRETDVLGLARAGKKKDYWEKVTRGILPLPEGIEIAFANERLEYWIRQIEKYSQRIRKHINDFNLIKDPVGFLSWIAGVIETIKAVINLITK